MERGADITTTQPAHTPRLSIVIITLNEANHIGTLLANLATQTCQQFEIILVDSNSDDDTVAIADSIGEQFAHYRSIVMSDRGVSLGRNTGAAAATTDHILFLDADTTLPDEFIHRLLTHIAHTPVDVGIMQIAYDMSTSTARTHRAFLYSFSYRVTNWIIKRTQRWSPTAIGACLYSTKRAHKAIGGFDQSITLCEDAHYAKSAAKAGLRVRVLPLFFYFNNRRFRHDGPLKTLKLYLQAAGRRLITNKEIGSTHRSFRYRFGHYRPQPKGTKKQH